MSTRKKRIAKRRAAKKSNGLTVGTKTGRVSCAKPNESNLQRKPTPVTSKVMNAYVDVLSSGGDLAYRVAAVDSETGAPVYLLRTEQPSSDPTEFLFSWTRDPSLAARFSSPDLPSVLVKSLGRRAAVVRPTRTVATRSDYDRVQAKIQCCRDAAEYLCALHARAEKEPWSYLGDGEEIREVISSAYADEEPVVCTGKDLGWPLEKSDGKAIVAGRNILWATSELLRVLAKNFWSQGDDVRNAITDLAEKVMAQKERNET